MAKRAILSVYDKTGLVEFARGLARLGYELVASGGTARALRNAELRVMPVESITGAPEILGGRVKTLHPAVHGGILARRTPNHISELAQHGISPVDVVVCNLYPFVQTVSQPDVTEAEAVEQIDIGGVTLLRAAAKNFESVVVVSNPDTYPQVLQMLIEGGSDAGIRRQLALEAFRHTAAYDMAISDWLGEQVSGETELPAMLHLGAQRMMTLRYGENPHQRAALYSWPGQDPRFRQLQGKELSYNNIVDLDAAWQMPWEFDAPCVAIIKHTNPCGLAVGTDLVDAFKKALACDPVSAFGSIIAVNREIDHDFAVALAEAKLFVEVLAAPSYSDKARERLWRRKKCRVMVCQPPGEAEPVIKNVAGGLLVQTPDTRGVHKEDWKVISERQPTEAEMAQLEFAWLAAKHIKSNAIVFCKDSATVGVGAGQMNRVDSVRLAAWRAGDKAKGAVLASDAFFPFPDGIEAAAEAGVTAVIQPGGSVKDNLVVEAANRLGLAMIATGERHFRH